MRDEGKFIFYFAFLILPLIAIIEPLVRMIRISKTKPRYILGGGIGCFSVGILLLICKNIFKDWSFSGSDIVTYRIFYVTYGEVAVVATIIGIIAMIFSIISYSICKSSQE